jgi:hypothetical protein
MRFTALSREERDALPDDAFAVPGKRMIPLHDERHVRMALETVLQAKGLTDQERAEARTRINARLLERVTFELQAMSLDMPTEEHPNRMPFSGILTRIDEASDEPPGGSSGKRVYIPSEVAREALPTLMGMGVDTTPEFDGHDARFKIGFIAEATIEGNAIHIAGFLYASDFPEECARIKAEKNRLGFSYECKVAISDKTADPWVVDRIIFTGAAILYKEKAAYRTTSLAATAEKDDAMTPEELKKLNDTLAALAASVTAIGEKVTKLEAGKGASLAGPIIDQAMPHVGACNAAADAMEAAGIGTHPTHGHAAVLRRVGASILHGASMGKLPHIFRDHSYLGGDGVEASVGKETQDKLDAAAKDLKDAKDAIAGLNTQIADLKAASERARATESAPARKSLRPNAPALMAKFGLKDGEQIALDKIDEVLKAAGVPVGQRTIEAKLKLRAEGLIAA